MVEFFNTDICSQRNAELAVGDPIALAHWNEYSGAKIPSLDSKSHSGLTTAEVTRAVFISTAVGVAGWYVAKKIPMVPGLLRNTFPMGAAENLLAPSLGQRLKFAVFHKLFMGAPAKFSAQEVLRREQLAAQETLSSVLAFESKVTHEPIKKLLEATAHSRQAQGGLAVLELGASNTTLVPRTLERGLGKYVSTDIYRSNLLKQREFLKAFPEVSGKAQQVVADTRALPFKSESFDLVVARCHPPFVVPNPKDMLHAVQESARVLRPDGVFIVEGHRFGFGGKAVRNEVQRLFQVIHRDDAAMLLALKLR